MQKTADRKIFEPTISLSLLSHRHCYGGQLVDFTDFTNDPVEPSPHSRRSLGWCVNWVSAFSATERRNSLLATIRSLSWHKALQPLSKTLTMRSGYNLIARIPTKLD